MAKPIALDQPTRAGIAKLLNERTYTYDNPHNDDRVRKLQAEIDAREKLICNRDPVLKRLRAEYTAVWNAVARKNNYATKLHKTVRRLFLAEGLTARVRKLAVKLAEALNQLND